MSSLNNISSNTRSMNGLNTINADDVNTSNLDVDSLIVNISSSVPTMPNGNNSLNIANTAFVQDAINTVGTNYVTTNTTQTLTTGVKTFTNLPECSAVPSSNNQLTNKQYVDNAFPTNYVTTNTTQTLTTGVKTFTNLPECSAVPSSNNQLVNKNYVDNKDFVNLTTNQTITSGIKTFNDNLVVGSGINSKTGSNLTLTTTGGEDVVINGSNDITFNSAFNTVFNASAYGSFQAGVGYTFVCNGGYGFKFIDNAIGGGFESTTSNNIVNTSLNNYNYNTASLFSPYLNGPNRAGIYSNTSTVLNPVITFQNGQATDIGVTFNALNVFVPIGNLCSMVDVSIPFDLLAWSTFGLPSATATIGLQFNGFTVVFLKNGVAYTPTKQFSFSPATGTTLNWNKTGAQSNIQGMGAYFGNLEIAFNIDINNTTADTYQVRINPSATITNYSINFDGFKFVCRNATGGQTNGNGFRTTSVTSYTGGTLTFAGGNPTFVDTSVTKVSLSYPVPALSNYCFMPLNNNIVPAGSISMWITSTPPDGYLICNGASISISTYGNLFNVIAFTYGGTFASGNFNLPNFQGAFLRGAGTQTVGGVAYTAGTVGTAQQDSVLALSSITNQGYWNIDAGGGGASRQVKARVRIGTDPVDSGAFGAGIDASFPRQNTTENRPFNHSVYYIIKF